MKTTKRSQSRTNLQNSFKARVLAVVKNIPRGSVLAYSEVARKAGSEGASRAVGTIMSKNYDSSVPCHRVVRSDGTIGGYNRGGEEVKRALLLKEIPNGKGK